MSDIVRITSHTTLLNISPPILLKESAISLENERPKRAEIVLRNDIFSGMRILLHNSFYVLFLVFAALQFTTASDIPRHGKPIVLFDGHGLDQFDTFLKIQGLNKDPDHVFQVEKNIIHVSGKEFGYIITKQEFQDYYLRAEFKWGEGTYAPREGHARDSGILYNIQGPQKVWPRSLEFQILEGGTGDFWLTDGGAVTARGTGQPGRKAKR